ncbi:hypothetical protein BDV29DRAFT_169804 [Aspergillus leporis]|jgi:hypothetical protein|uniref:Uncharacterized protein n=1 Tax=Aspergillus leporis TaxID=41062 RepID=A0A5N5X7C1_9EURO|nr:hypothetical protein BDV29DRAFT_169804 [Aspergillus leporis]
MYDHGLCLLFRQFAVTVTRLQFVAYCYQLLFSLILFPLNNVTIYFFLTQAGWISGPFLTRLCY